jgi:hypothetical protein
VAAVGGDEATIAAAYLHDDTDTTVDQLIGAFGSLEAASTSPPSNQLSLRHEGLTVRDHRKEHDVAGIAGMRDLFAVMVQCVWC